MTSVKQDTCAPCRISNLFQEHFTIHSETQENHSLSRPLPKKNSNFMAVHPNEFKNSLTTTTTTNNNNNNNNSILLQKCQQVIWAIADRLFCAFICAPVVVVYWRGGWSIMDSMLLPKHTELSAWISLTIGCFINCLFTLMQNYFDTIRRNTFLFFFFSRLYTAIFGLACINSWRGLWELLDLYAGKTLTTTALTILGALLILIFLKGVRNLTSPPMLVLTDNPKDYFKVVTFYSFQEYQLKSMSIKTIIGLILEVGLILKIYLAATQREQKRNPKSEKQFKSVLMYHVQSDLLTVKMGPRWGWWVKFADVLFGVVLIGSLVVTFWRGIWILFDDFIYPDNLKQSGVVSLLVGYSLVAATYLLEPVVYRGCQFLKGPLRLALADVYSITASIAAISIWRGVWCIFDWTWNRYTEAMWPAWAAHFGAFFVLVGLYCSNTVVVRGVMRDGAEPGGECINLQCSYFTTNEDYYLRQKSSEIKSRAVNIASSFETVECYM